MENLAQEVQELRRCGNTRQVENLDVGSYQRKINKRKKRWYLEQNAYDMDHPL
jgi:hypothetical protein